MHFLSMYNSLCYSPKQLVKNLLSKPSTPQPNLTSTNYAVSTTTYNDYSNISTTTYNDYSNISTTTYNDYSNVSTTTYDLITPLLDFLSWVKISPINSTYYSKFFLNPFISSSNLGFKMHNYDLIEIVK